MRFIRNGAIEQQLRDHFRSLGYNTHGMTFHAVQLSSIEPPGWIQEFCFDLSVRHPTRQWERLQGTCRDDERTSSFLVRLQSEEQGDGADDRHGQPRATPSPERPLQPQSSPLGLLIFAVAALVIAAVGLTIRALSPHLAG